MRIWFLIFLLSSCAWTAEQNKVFYFNRVKENLHELLPADLRERCYSNLDQLSIPETSSSPEKAPGFASYNTRTHAVVIAPGYYASLAHEYQHFLNHLSNNGNPVEWDCLDQLSAYQSQRILELEEKTVRLEQQLFAAGMRRRK